MELQSDSEDSFESDSENTSSVGNHQNRKDTLTSKKKLEVEFKPLTERELEDKEDILIGSLEEILRKLEEKGGELTEIEKYKEMRIWRQKRDKTVREQLE